MAAILTPEDMFGPVTEGQAERTEKGEFIVPLSSLAILASEDGTVQIVMPQSQLRQGSTFISPNQAIFLQLVSNLTRNPSMIDELMAQFVEEHGLPQEMSEVTFSKPPTKREVN